MDGRTVLVTGSTGGIGKETARALAARGARVVLTGRDPARAAAAAAELREGTGNAAVEAFTADVTSQREVRALAAAVTDRHGALHCLVNNAGVNPPGRLLTEDGIESAFAGNVLAPYLLTRLLLAPLRRGAEESGEPSRVVNVTGGIPRGTLDPGNLQAEKRFSGWLTDTQYNRSKLALTAMSRTLAGHCAERGVAVTVVYPGHADTPMNRALPTRTYPRLVRPFVPLVRALMPVLWGDTAAPARNVVRAVTGPAAPGGGYLDMKGRRSRWPAGTGDPVVRAAIWEMCERLAPLSGGSRCPGSGGSGSRRPRR
ncbi:SDR family NAD(P)-dependent oxidoreductase [Streptomyces sp. NPDC048172]|uniref:SDR family NAD(P)-dependent oxidoreductase n=1 Tax=Streptomyces sp. NPDC048172 TaxID=3365505 RepID=UPI00371BE8C1